MYSDPTNPYNPNETTQPNYFQNQPSPSHPLPLLSAIKPKRSLFRWYRRQRNIIKLGIGCPASLVAAFILLFLVFFVIALASPSTWQTHASPQTQTTHQVAHAHVSTVTLKPRPTVKLTPKPTVAPKPTPPPGPPTPPPAPVQQQLQSQPTQPPVQQAQPTQPPAPPPAPVCNGTVDDSVCYNTNSNGGTAVTNPPADFCSYFACVSTFWKDTNGSVAECANGKYTHSYGVSGACSRDGGVLGPLYSH